MDSVYNQPVIFFSVMQLVGNSWKIDTFREAITYDFHLNSKNSYASVFVSRFFFFETCLNVGFISCRLMKSVRFQTVPIRLHYSVSLLLPF